MLRREWEPLLRLRDWLAKGRRRRGGIGTLLFDVFDEDAADWRNVLDFLLLAGRLGVHVYPTRALVSRCGRPDLFGPALPVVRTATLLIVGGGTVA